MIHYSDYLREQATKYRVLAEAATEPEAKQEFLELAAACSKSPTTWTTVPSSIGKLLLKRRR